jgi:hypothetical protein
MGKNILNIYSLVSIFFVQIYLVFFYSHAQASSTSITGEVTDGDTGEPLYFVNVYLDGTTIGTTTDENGYYSMEDLPLGGYDLIFSHVAYQVQSRSIHVQEYSSLKIDVLLQLKIFKSSVINVIAEEPKVWRKRLNEFKKMFLGKTENAKKTYLVNPEVLEFRFDSTTNELIAFADSDLVIENHALGYRIINQIQAFKWSDVIIEHQIYSRFEQLTAVHENDHYRWEENRKRTYEGSFKHFLSAFANQRLKEEGFDIYHGDLLMFQEGFGEHLNPKALYPLKEKSKGSSYKRLFFKRWLKVIYLMHVPQKESFLKLASGAVLVDSLGNFLIAPIIEKAGFWGESRIADRLPLDFRPKF